LALDKKTLLDKTKITDKTLINLFMILPTAFDDKYSC